MTIDAVGAVGASTPTPATSPTQIKQAQEHKRLQDQKDQVGSDRQAQDQQRLHAGDVARTEQTRLAAERADQDRSQRQRQNQTPNANGRVDMYL